MALNHLQVKIGTDFYPQLGIQGNGVLISVNNYEYLRWLFKAFFKLLNPGACSINPHNFARNSNPIRI